MLRAYGIRSLPLALMMLMTAPAFSWGPGGHMITAYIAYGRLNKSAKKAVDGLIAIAIDPAAITAKSLDFVNASHWPDDLRDPPYKDEFAYSFPMHFADFPFSPDHTVLPTDLPATVNVITALHSYVNVLKNTTDNKARAQALRFIIHFVGDIQQPLHCSTEITGARHSGDQGGNLFIIQVGDGQGAPRAMKLHSYWDGGIGDFPKGGPAPDFAPPPLEQIPAAASRLTNKFPDKDLAWDVGPTSFEMWATESSRLAQDVAYAAIAPNSQPTNAYNAAALNAAQKRVVWGGYRLAALLNSIWPDDFVRE